MSQVLWFAVLKLKAKSKPIYTSLNTGVFKDVFYVVCYFVGGRGLEPPFLTEPVPKTGVSTISPPAHVISIVLECLLSHKPAVTDYTKLIWERFIRRIEK